VTNAGQTAIRDIIADNNPQNIIADNNPQIPEVYAFGTRQTQPAESDTSLTSRVQGATINRRELQNLDTATEFESAIPPISDDRPLTVDSNNNALTHEPVTYISEAENAITSGGNVFNSAGTLSNGQGVNINTVDDIILFEFTLNQDVPAGELRVGTYAELDNWDGTVNYSLDGNLYRSVTRNGVTSQNDAEGGFVGVNTTKLEAGTTHQLLLRTTAANSGDHIVDVLFAFDNRFNIGVDGSSFNGSTYAKPQLFADQLNVSFADVKARRNLNELELFQAWNDTSNSAAVTLNLGSQSKTVNNPTRNANGNIRETLTVSAANASRTGSIDITLSRIDNTTSGNTPRNGNERQEVSFHVVDGISNGVSRSNIGEATSRTVFDSGLLQGNTLRESGQTEGADLLTHSIFADVEPGNNVIIGSERIQFIPK